MERFTGKINSKWVLLSYSSVRGNYYPGGAIDLLDYGQKAVDRLAAHEEAEKEEV